MGLTYFKRYRMEIDLAGHDFGRVEVPPGYVLLPWHHALLGAHAEAKYLSFRDEIDANIFPCLGEQDGCHRLMREISRKKGFIPKATWLAATDAANSAGRRLCGTVQGIRNRDGIGTVQNLGIVARDRDLGLGTSLLYRALSGFQDSGLSRVCLEVTAENDGATRLYHRLGFVTVKTVFKAVDVAHV